MNQSESDPRRHALALAAVKTDQILGLDSVLLRAPRESASVPGPGEPLEDVSNSADALLRIRTDHDEHCPHCTCSTHHTQTVFGEGDPEAELMFIGEAPGAEEDRTGRPFVGRAGAKLDEMIKAMGYRREDVYIANVLKSRPPNNRTPMDDEVAACSPYLSRQVAAIKPRAIVALGGPAAKLLLMTETGITRLRGHWGTYDADGLEVPVMPTFHPAYILRNPSREVRLQVWEDLQLVMTLLGRSPVT